MVVVVVVKAATTLEKQHMRN